MIRLTGTGKILHRTCDVVTRPYYKQKIAANQLDKELDASLIDGDPFDTLIQNGLMFSLRMTSLWIYLKTYHSILVIFIPPYREVFFTFYNRE